MCNRSYLFLIVLFCLAISCGRSKEQIVEEKNGNSDQLTDNDSVGVKSEPENEAQVGSIQAYTLKWKSVSYDEYGISYGFENQNGEEIFFFHLSIPGFSDQENDYYTSSTMEDRIFPLLEIKEEIKDKWFEVKAEIQEMENDSEPSEKNKVPVIISIKPI